MKRVIASITAVVLLLIMTGCQNKVYTAPETTAPTTTTTVTVASTVPSTTTVNASPTKATTKKTTKPTKPYLPAPMDPAYSRLLLVNNDHPLPDDFDKSVQLTKISSQYLNGSLNQIDKEIHPYVINMIEAAKADGITLYVRSPYRSYSTQKYLFNNKVNSVIKSGTPKEEAEAKAALSVARPGTSEHQTGLAIDFNTASYKFENTATHKWMIAHAADYGFILRYPDGKTDITGIKYEPWHWRFVGINVAKEISARGITLEEYLLPSDNG